MSDDAAEPLEFSSSLREGRTRKVRPFCFLRPFSSYG
ncbi:hypothetical protein ACVMHZ_000390 [Bradyrhizobium liaoningense]